MSVIRVTLADKSVQEFPFERSSQLTVESTIQVEAAITQRQSRSWADVDKVEIRDGSVDGSLEEPEYVDRPGLASPEAAILWAGNLPLADAAAHVEQASVLFPKHGGLEELAADLGDAVRAGAETWSSDVVDELRAEPGQAPEPGDDTETPEPTEAAKALAAEQHVALWNVTGTGADGRVTKDDVERYLAERGR